MVTCWIFLLISPLGLKDPVLATIHCALCSIGKQKPRYHVNQNNNRRGKSIHLVPKQSHLSILLFTCKLALVASFLNAKFKRIFSLKRGNKGSFSRKQRILKWRPFWNKVYYAHYWVFTRQNHHVQYNRLSPHSTSVRTNNNTRARLGWTFSYICCIVLHPDLDSVSLFIGMQERSIVIPRERIVNKLQTKVLSRDAKLSFTDLIWLLL